MGELAAATYVGQVERDPDGVLWAVLYCGDLLVSRERVRSLRKGKRRVADLVLSASDTHAAPYPHVARPHESAGREAERDRPASPCGTTRGVRS